MIALEVFLRAVQGETVLVVLRDRGRANEFMTGLVATIRSAGYDGDVIERAILARGREEIKFFGGGRIVSRSQARGFSADLVVTDVLGEWEVMPHTCTSRSTGAHYRRI